RQGRFEAMHDRLFEQPESFGLKSWSDYAKEAGVPDLTAFEICTQSAEPVPQLTAGEKLARQLDLRGTPTLIVNGWKLPEPPKEPELNEMVQAILHGKSPVAVENKKG